MMHDNFGSGHFKVNGKRMLKFRKCELESLRKFFWGLCLLDIPATVGSGFLRTLPIIFLAGTENTTKVTKPGHFLP